MAANPSLVQAPDGSRVPAPFQGEVILCQRKGMGFNIDGLNTRGGKYDPVCVLLAFPRKHQI